jgi:YVTN family beta-propeller protein
MGDSEVVIVNLGDGSLASRLPRVGSVRGIAVGANANAIFATAAASDELVIIDASTLTERSRVSTGRGPDGVAWDADHHVVGVSDQRAGAISLISNNGTGTRFDVGLGTETGNVVYDHSRGRFWITVVRSSPPNQLVGVDPASGRILARLDLPGCEGAHGLRIHPDGQSAFIACENNSVLLRVSLAAPYASVTARVGTDPDVLSIDTPLGWLYVAAESGDLTVFDIAGPGLAPIDHERFDNSAHTVAVDSVTHRVFLPLVRGRNGHPVLRILRPSFR